MMKTSSRTMTDNSMRQESTINTFKATTISCKRHPNQKLQGIAVDIGAPQRLFCWDCVQKHMVKCRSIEDVISSAKVDKLQADYEKLFENIKSKSIEILEKKIETVIDQMIKTLTASKTHFRKNIFKLASGSALFSLNESFETLKAQLKQFSANNDLIEDIGLEQYLVHFNKVEQIATKKDGLLSAAEESLKEIACKVGDYHQAFAESWNELSNFFASDAAPQIMTSEMKLYPLVHEIIEEFETNREKIGKNEYLKFAHLDKGVSLRSSSAQVQNMFNTPSRRADFSFPQTPSNILHNQTGGRA